MKFILPILFMVSGCAAQQVDNEELYEQQVTVERDSVIEKSGWNHGSATCKNNTEKSHDVYKHSEKTFIIRQNKCLTFEAPFIYVLAGKDKVLVVDTGALKDTPAFSFSAEIENIIGKTAFNSKEIVVVHSHGHGDHYQGDSSFENVENVTLVGPTKEDLNSFFGFANWPKEQATINLGDREITIIPTPGHQEAAITIYDNKTKWLITGDTLYPGLIYVKDWQAYRESIQSLSTFSNENEVAAIMGAHIEMTKKPSLYYPIGTTYQPNEANLDLSAEELHELNKKLTATDAASEIVFDRFVIRPMSGFQKTLSNMAKWFKE